MKQTIDIEGKYGEYFDSVYLNGVPLLPDKSQKVFNHSPDGFSWGYAGSGPAQLALAILLEVTDEETALANYQRFKTDHVANWPPSFAVKIDMEPYGMKIRQPNLKIFLSKIEYLETDVVPRLKATAEVWLDQQIARVRSAEDAAIARAELETLLDEYREGISEIYDFMNEKGLVDVHAEKEPSAT